MAKMSDAGLRLIPIVDQHKGDFHGIAADGDIRRYLSGGGSLSDGVISATNRFPVTLDEHLTDNELLHRMRRLQVEYLPEIVNGKLFALHVLWATPPQSKLTAVIMAGGLGTRLAPLTEECPKPMIEVGGKPILQRIIVGLRDQGITNFILSVNYLSHKIIDYFGDGSSFGVTISFVHETERKGTGGALALIDPAELSDPFLCLNGDILNDINVDELVNTHNSNHWSATMVVRDFSYTIPYGVVHTAENGSYQRAEEKPTTKFMINAGFYALSKSVLPLVPASEFYDLPTLFEDLAGNDVGAGTFAHSGRWIDIGNMTELERARQIFKDNT